MRTDKTNLPAAILSYIRENFGKDCQYEIKRIKINGDTYYSVELNDIDKDDIVHLKFSDSGKLMKRESESAFPDPYTGEDNWDGND